MNKQIVAIDKAPAAVGPYSQGVSVGGFVFTAGQIGLDPATGKLVGDDVASQTRRALENLEAILQAAGSCLRHAVKTTVYLADIADFGAMNVVYAEFFSEEPPARATLQAVALPLGARVEIDVVAEACECEKKDTESQEEEGKCHCC
jgi:2-iminobutanoate/2-iminopropanoate deaminase